MPEVRQEVIIATAVVLSALVTYIGFQAMYPQTKASFSPKRATVKKGKADSGAEAKVAPNKNNLSEEKVGGKILEK